MNRRTQVYESLVEGHAAHLFRLACRLCGDRALAEDLVQEAFAEAWRSLPGLREEKAARAWLVQILRHRYWHACRRAGRRPRTEALPEDLMVAAPTPEPCGEEPGALQRALDRLRPQARELLLLVFMEGYRCREAAEMLGLPLGTVLSRLHRARGLLERYLAEERRVEADEISNVLPLRRRSPA